jgi:hypothetical protein
VRFELLRGAANLWKVRNECIAHWKWPARRRHGLDRTGDIVDHKAFDQTQPVVVETA